MVRYYSTYVQYLQTFQHVNRKIADLLEYLTQPPKDIPQWIKNLQTEEAWIVESSSQGLMQERLTTPADLILFLDQSGPPKQLRLILHNYSNANTMSRDWISHLGNRFDLSPIFFFNHLAYTGGGQAFDYDDEMRCFQELPSKRPSLEIGCAPWLHASVALHHDSVGSCGTTGRPLAVHSYP